MLQNVSAVANVNSNVQEQDEKQRLEREEHEVLADARQVKDRIGLAKDHLVIQQHDRIRHLKKRRHVTVRIS